MSRKRIEVKYLEPETVEIQFNDFIVIRLTLDEVNELMSKLGEAI